jgi:hypothetical protein
VKKINKILSAIYCISFFIFSFSDSMPESNMVTQSRSATASLNIKIHIPATLYLQSGAIMQKKNVYTSDVKPANKTDLALQRKNGTIKTPGLIFKGGMVVKSSNSNHLANGSHSKTTRYILCSP